MPPCGAFTPCAEASSCSMPGGCVNQRFERPVFDVGNDLKKNAKASNDVRERKVRDPRFIKRKRRAIRP